MEPRNHRHDSDACCNGKAGDSTRQTLSELDFERGIWSAAQSNDLERVKRLLDKCTPVDVEDTSGYTGLHYAARNGHETICRELLRRGANANATTRSGRATPLQRAASQGHTRVVQLLLDAGADPNARDADSLTALHRAVAAECDDVVRLLIPRTRLDLVDKDGCTPLRLAEKKGKQDLFS